MSCYISTDFRSMKIVLWWNVLMSPEEAATHVPRVAVLSESNRRVDVISGVSNG